MTEKTKDKRLARATTPTVIWDWDETLDTISDLRRNKRLQAVVIFGRREDGSGYMRAEGFPNSRYVVETLLEAAESVTETALKEGDPDIIDMLFPATRCDA